MVAVIRWIFEDPYTPRTVTLPVNPEKMGSPFPPRPVNGFTNLAGGVLVTEGSGQPATWTFEGGLLTKAHYDLMYDFFYGDNSRRRINITDHLGRVFTCVPVSWSPEPARSATHRWRHTWTANVVVAAYDLSGAVSD